MKKKSVKHKVKSKKVDRVRARKPAAAASGNQKNLDWTDLMLKILGRLEALEQKMEVLIHQTAGSSEEIEPESFSMNRTEVSGGSMRVLDAPREFDSREAAEEPAQPKESSKVPGKNTGRRGRPFFQAVCAECKISCEIPFKPTGERPVYCKSCFAKRKSEKKTGSSQAPAAPALVEQRIVKVIPNGVGRVTIREMVPAPVPAQPAFSGHRQRPPQRQKSQAKSSHTGAFKRHG